MPDQRSTAPDQHPQALVHTGSLAASPRATDSAKVRQYRLREHGLWQEPHLRSAGAPWRKGKLVIVIGLLKALGHDQMSYSKPKSLVQIFQVIQRQEKGIDLIMIIEVTTHTADIWKRARTTVAMVCLSLELASSPGFQNVPNSEVALGHRYRRSSLLISGQAPYLKEKTLGVFCILAGAAVVVKPGSCIIQSDL